jgi:cellulose synthase/poly-beta-1,6-N-acetylglucosamine synthase-like glycosyltransferase
MTTVSPHAPVHAKKTPPRTRLRGLALVAVLGLLTMFFVKLEFRSPRANTVFYGYGCLVTGVILLTMTISFALYKDPALMAPLTLAARRAASDDPDGGIGLDNGLVPGGDSVTHPLVSCVVAVHNEELLVRACILSMLRQTYDNTEVIVVNDASTDGSAAILDQLAAEHPVQLVHLTKNVGKKSALTRGLQNAKGSIIAFADSDTIWAPDALELAVPIFVADPKVGAVSGHCRGLNAQQNLLTKTQDAWYEGQFAVRKAFESVFNSVTCVSGPLAIFRLAAIYNFMPAWEADTFLGQEFRFATDRTLTAYVLGGRQLGPRILPKWQDSPFATPAYPLEDWKIVYSKATKAWTSIPPTIAGILKQQVRWKKSFIRNIPVTGRFYWRRPLLPALFYYVHVAFVILGPWIAARHLIYMPLRGNPMSLVLYLAGISLIGLSFGLAFRAENPGSRQWLYRPIMGLMSCLMLSWLIFYSAITIKKMRWHRG